jgi:hypothetical protein
MTETIIEENLKAKEKNILHLLHHSLDIPVFRVFTINRLIQLFKEKQNTLVKPKVWDDPFENFFFQQTVRGNKGSIGTFEHMRESFYGQCWTRNFKETDALWRIYSPLKNGVRVKTTLRKLFDSFYDTSIEHAAMHFTLG